MAVHTQWQSTTAARMPPKTTSVEPAMCSGQDWNRHTVSSPSTWLFTWRPRGLSVPHPKQWCAGRRSWMAWLTGRLLGGAHATTSAHAVPLRPPAMACDPCPMRRAMMAVAALALGLACGKDPVSYSGPVGISLSARSNDVTGGNLSVDKNVNTETGNPCGAYVHAAEQALGHVPAVIQVQSVTLALQPGSTGVTGLQQVFGGTATVSFVLNGSGNVF